MGRHRDASREANDPSRYSSWCRGKEPYPSKHVALGVLRVMMKRSDIRLANTLGAYHCATCRKWHLGNSRRRGGDA